jgi:DNA-directed RNA polymerase specialized sigma24 family protein
MGYSHDNSEIRWNPDTEQYVRRATRTWCSRLGIKGEDIKDLEQDAVMTAWNKVENGKIHYKEGLWFIARNTVLDFRAKANRIETTALDEQLAREPSNPLDKILIEEVQREFPELILLAAARTDGFEWDLIAQSLGISSGTLRVRYSRLVKKANEHFNKSR